MLLICDAFCNQFHKNFVSYLENTSHLLEDANTKMFSFNTSAFVFSFGFNINVFVENCLIPAKLYIRPKKTPLYFLKRKLESNQEIHLQAVDWLLLFNNITAKLLQ